MKRIGFLIALAVWVAPMAQAQSVLEVRAEGSFEEVKQLLVIAIEGQGLVVAQKSGVKLVDWRTVRAALGL